METNLPSESSPPFICKHLSADLHFNDASRTSLAYCRIHTLARQKIPMTRSQSACVHNKSYDHHVCKSQPCNSGRCHWILPKHVLQAPLSFSPGSLAHVRNRSTAESISKKICIAYVIPQTSPGDPNGVLAEICISYSPLPSTHGDARCGRLCQQVLHYIRDEELGIE